MADNTTPPENVAAVKPAKGKLLAAGIVSVVIIAESVVAYLVFPPAPDAAALTNGQLEKAEQLEAGLSGDATNSSHADAKEVELGDFTISAYQPSSNTTLRIDFRIYGLVEKEVEDEFLSMMAQATHRFREQVIVTVRSAELTDLSDPGLGLIKRRILEKINRSFAKPLLQEIIDDFSFVEQ